MTPPTLRVGNSNQGNNPSRTILERNAFQPSSLTSTQQQVDGMVTVFVDQASDWRSLAALMAGSAAYRYGRIGFLSASQNLLPSLQKIPAFVKGGSVLFGLGTEVSAFEFTHRTLLTLSPHPNPLPGGERGNPSFVTAHLSPNLWSWSGPHGLAQGWLHSFVSFGAIKGFGRLANGQNIVLQHGLQDVGMVAGHQLAYQVGLGERPEGSLAEQLAQAEVVNLQLAAGTGLAHYLAGGRLLAWEKGLDLSLQSQEKLFSIISSQPTWAFETTGEKGLPFPSLDLKSEKKPTPLLMASLDPEGPRGTSKTERSTDPFQQISEQIATFHEVRAKTLNVSAIEHAPPEANPREWAQQEYQKKVLDPIEDFIRRAQTDEHYRTLEVLDAILLFPVRPDLPDHFAGSASYDVPGEGPGALSLRTRLHDFLGTTKGGVIQNLKPEDVVSLYQAARNAHQNHQGHLFFQLLDRTQNIDDLKRMIEFLTSFQKMPREEQKRLLKYFFLINNKGNIDFPPSPLDPNYQKQVESGSAIPLSPIEPATKIYQEGQTPSALLTRLEALSARKNIPFLLKIGIPKIVESLKSFSGETVPGAILDAVLNLEWRAATAFSAPKNSNDTSMILFNDLSLLTGKTLNDYDYQSPDFDFKDTESFLEGISKDITSLPDPLRSIATERLLAEKNHPHWQVRFVVSALYEGLLRGNPDPIKTRSFVSDTVKLLQDRSQSVQSRALETCLSLIQFLPSAEAEVLLNQIGLGKRLHGLLNGKSVKGNLKSLSLAERGWPHLNSQEKAEWINALDQFIFQKAPKDIALSAFHFLAHHSAEMSETLKNDLGSRPQMASLLLGWLIQATRESWTIRVREMAKGALPFYLTIASKENLKFLEGWAWQVVQSKASPLSVSGGLFLLSRFFSSTWASPFNSTLRSKALHTVLLLLSDKNDSTRRSALHYLSEMLKGAHPAEKEAVFRDYQRIIQDNDPSPLAIMLGSTRKGAPRNTQEALYRQFYYLMAFVELVKQIPEWQNEKALTLFRNYFSGDLLAHLKKLTANLSPRQFPPLFEVLFDAFYTKEGKGYALLIKHLIEKSQSPGQFQQVIPFFRDFNALPSDVKNEFAAHVLEESQKTASGLSKPKGSSTIFLDPPRAHSRLRRFLSDRFVGSLGGTKKEREALKNDLQKRIKLWEQDRFLAHMASLASFSTPRGKEAILGFVNDLISVESNQATVNLGSRRFRNPRRYQSMEGAFSQDFIRRWANEEKDRLIPLGSLEAQGILESDPLALRRAKYDYSALQIANHLKVPGASHLEGPALTDAIIEKIKRLPLESVPESQDWVEMMKDLLGKMGQREEIFESEVEGAIQFIKEHPSLALKLGGQGQEVLSDLQEMKRTLNAEVLKGKAWLVVTSNPADFIGSGRDPVTCQDPTRNTGFNKDGQPINRAREGRFLYAKVILAHEAHLEDGTAVFSPDAQVVGRSHLEVTTASAHPDPASSPHLLVERAYVHPGFIYKKQFAEALNHFASELGIDPQNQVHIQFAHQGMLQYPRPLKDSKPIYRDTFH